MEPIAEYRERSPNLRRKFTLYPEELVVEGRELVGARFQKTIPLQGLRPEFGWISFRSPRCVHGLAVCLAFAVMSGVWIWGGPVLLPAFVPIVASFVCCSAFGLACCFYYLPRYLAYTFVDRNGKDILQVIASGPDKGRCRAFTDQIAAEISRVTTPPDPFFRPGHQTQ